MLIEVLIRGARGEEGADGTCFHVILIYLLLLRKQWKAILEKHSCISNVLSTTCKWGLLRNLTLGGTKRPLEDERKAAVEAEAEAEAEAAVPKRAAVQHAAKPHQRNDLS